MPSPETPKTTPQPVNQERRTLSSPLLPTETNPESQVIFSPTDLHHLFFQLEPNKKVEFSQFGIKPPATPEPEPNLTDEKSISWNWKLFSKKLQKTDPQD